MAYLEIVEKMENNREDTGIWAEQTNAAPEMNNVYIPFCLDPGPLMLALVCSRFHFPGL